MQTRYVIGLVLLLSGVVRCTSALIPAPGTPRTAATGTAPDPTAAIAEAQQRFREFPDTIRASRGGNVMLPDGTIRHLGDNSADQAIREALANRSDAELRRDFPGMGPAPAPSRTPIPGEPMLVPTPSR